MQAARQAGPPTLNTRAIVEEENTDAAGRGFYVPLLAPGCHNGHEDVLLITRRDDSARSVHQSENNENKNDDEDVDDYPAPPPSPPPGVVLRLACGCQGWNVRLGIPPPRPRRRRWWPSRGPPTAAVVVVFVVVDAPEDIAAAVAVVGGASSMGTAR
jgi:hypothetical protein